MKAYLATLLLAISAFQAIIAKESKMLKNPAEMLSVFKLPTDLKVVRENVGIPQKAGNMRAQDSSTVSPGWIYATFASTCGGESMGVTGVITNTCMVSASQNTSYYFTCATNSGKYCL
jgi:hypothetical protein